MVMPRNAPITDYFMRLNQARQKKRPFLKDGSEESRESIRRKSPSSSPNLGVGVRKENDALSSSTEGPYTSVGHGPASSSQRLPSSYVALEQPSYSSLSPVSDETVTARDFGRPHPTSSPGDHTAGGALLRMLPVPFQNTTSSQKDVNPPSQSVLTSSQRIVRDGETMIRNSDDESDDSLEDLEELFRGKRPAIPEPQLPSPDNDNAMQTRGKAAQAKSADISASMVPVMPKKYKYSLESLGKQRRQDEAAEENIARAKAVFETIDQQKASAGEKKRVIDTDFIESVMKDHGDEDEIGRLRTAIQRTEALEQGKSWSFFKEEADEPLFELSDFPTVEDQRLQRMFGENLPRQQAFMSGFAGEHAMKFGLPEEILLWIMDAICLEPRDDLRYSYTSTLSDATRHFAPLVTPEYIGNLFQKLGATDAALDIGLTVVPQLTLSQNVDTPSRPCLLSIIMLLGSLAGGLPAKSRIHLLITLCRLALDRTIVKDTHAISALEETFANLIGSIPGDSVERELQAVLTKVYNTIDDAALRLQMLQIIPAWSSRLLLLRQRLALAFLFQDSSYIIRQPSTLVTLKSITRRLQGPQFKIKKGTDFGELAALVGILSIGLDCGDPPSSPASKDEHIAFNKDVDSLSSKINSMFNDIIDTGASHIKRTEAKEVLEGFQRRLEYSIRTKPKPKRLVFGGAEVIPLQENLKAWVGQAGTMV